MTIKRFGKRLAKITGIMLGIIALLLVAFHIWFVYHAKAMLEDTVEKQTNGKIKLKIEKLHYNYFSRKMILDNAVFFTTDTLTASSSYRFHIIQLRLKLKALLPLLLDKKLLIDSLSLLSPDIQVTTLRYVKDTVTRADTANISIPYEMGKVYKSIRDGLRVLKVNRFQIYNGTFILVNKASPDQLPLRIGNIDFQIDNLQVDTNALAQKDKIFFSDNITLKSTNQHIIFPDGRHSLSYRKFRINLQKQLVEFDSCTIAANRKDSTGSSFRVFFDSLLLTHIDFDTLYRTEVIKADSVYCINPAFSLYVELGSKKGKKTAAPKLENIIEQLTGDLQLGYVGVKNGDFNIRTTRDGKPSSFVSRQNNFDMEGLQVDQDAAKPIRVKSFTMAIRNYENFISDSSYQIKFDSILFRDDRITLSNFLFNKLDNGKPVNTFSVPRFSLEGLSWDYLVFEKRIRARLAAMYQPHIIYSSSLAKGIKKERQSIFQSLGALNDYMDLDQLDITDGDIDLHLRNNLQVKLNHATLSVRSNSLLTSTRLSGIRNSLTSLDFANGQIRAGDLLIMLDGIRYTGSSGQFEAGHVSVSNHQKNMAITVNDASIQQLQVDEHSGDINASGINWQSGNMQIESNTVNTPGHHTPLLQLKKINGANTTISALINHQLLKADLAALSLDELELKPGHAPVINNLATEGKNLQFSKGATNISAAVFRVEDKKESTLSQFRYSSKSTQRTDSVIALSVAFVPDISSLINGVIILKQVQLNKPVMSFRTVNTAAKVQQRTSGISSIQISDLLLNAPTFYLSRQNDKGILSLQWNGADQPGNFLRISNLTVKTTEEPSVNIGRLNMYISNFSIHTTKEKYYSTGKGSIEGQLEQLRFTQKTDDNPEWNVLFRKFSTRNLQLDSLGKNSGQLNLQQAVLNNLHLNDNNITKLKTLVTNNPEFSLQDFTGHYNNTKNRFRWYNAGFTRHSNMLALDSFAYEPAIGRDSFLAAKAFQSDYIKAGCGPLAAGPLLVDEWLDDSTLHVRNASIHKAYFSDYKDRSKPFKSGLIKPLPADLLRSIPVHLLLDTVQFTNAEAEYTEMQEKAKRPAIVPIKRMTVTLYNVKNKKTMEDDSLRIHANGYLLDTVWVRLRVKESYTDSLGGFLMTVRLKPGDLRVLNPLLIPMASVKLVSGELDTLSMRAVGREYLALGEMKMYYDNLKIELLKKGTDSAKTFFTRLKNFIANTFVIRRNNHSRTGDVFFIRQRDRSAINYLIKITISGMASSVGAKNNKKMLRRYAKELEKRKLPPIDMD